MKHELKIEVSYYDAVKSGDKNFEIRYNDRGYQKGDTVILNAWWKGGEGNCYCSEREPIEAIIKYVSNYQQKDGWVVFGFELKEQG